jgi:hypothetical protein
MGFEVIVRPAVFPSIRPAPARVLAPSGSDPTQGLAILSGGGGKFVGLSYSWNVSVSRAGTQQETRRQFDTQRVYQVDGKGNINQNNYVDVEQLKKITFREEGDPIHTSYVSPPNPDNVKTIAADVTRDAGGDSTTGAP